MRVLINALSARRGGGQTYLINLLDHLDIAGDVEVSVLAPRGLVLPERPGLHLRVVIEGGVAMGPGRAELLEGIRETGSIAAAGRRMGMSYKRAWGLVETMNAAFSGLVFGLIEAIVLIYLLIVVNFHSWSDPFVIVMALPAALAGIAWTLFATHTSLSVPALTGAIMCMGVATAYSILVVSFARERLDATGDAVTAAIEAGVTRFRPVLMTALAMIIGMAPMALGLGEGGEQNAPLGRAVIGGLMFATVATLFFVPAVFVLVRGRPATDPLPGAQHVPAE